jgi:hypothetical protein
VSLEKYQPASTDCTPAVINSDPGEVTDPKSPMMQAVFAVWKNTPREGRAPFHRVCCLNSCDPKDLALARASSQCVVESALLISEVK